MKDDCLRLQVELIVSAICGPAVASEVGDMVESSVSYVDVYDYLHAKAGFATASKVALLIRKQNQESNDASK